MRNPITALVQSQLECMIDAHGLAEVVDAIGDICGAKAQHIRETWQDEGLARTWDAAGRAMIRANGDARVQRAGR